MHEYLQSILELIFPKNLIIQTLHNIEEIFHVGTCYCIGICPNTGTLIPPIYCLTLRILALGEVIACLGAMTSSGFRFPWPGIYLRTAIACSSKCPPRRSDPAPMNSRAGRSLVVK